MTWHAGAEATTNTLRAASIPLRDIHAIIERVIISAVEHRGQLAVYEVTRALDGGRLLAVACG